MFQIDYISYSYGKNKPKVLKDVNVELPEGCTVLLGENGCGKTTLMKLMAGLLKPASGSFRFNGEQRYLEQIAYLPQQFSVYPEMKVEEILLLVAGLRAVPRARRKADAAHALEQLHIEDYARVKFKNCSGGIQRRVGIACTLVGDPKLVFLDEPTVGIDPKERLKIYQLMQSCFQGKTVILSTHVIDDIRFLADYIFVLEAGEVSYASSAEDFYQQNNNDVWNFFGGSDCENQEKLAH